MLKTLERFPLTDSVKQIVWKKDALSVLDQRLLPREIKYIECRTAEDVAEAIRSMALRGAPLIGCAAAYGMALAARSGSPSRLAAAGASLRKARPTAVNLAHAIEAMLTAAKGGDLAAGVTKAAEAYFQTDLAGNQAMAQLGASLLKKGSRIITYCNAGSLATSGFGTSIGVIRFAHHEGKIAHVYPCETRPYLQGSRLTLWELMQARVPSTLITDNMAAHLMKTVGIDACIVGSDRIAANADVCNKIGTYGLAILAKHHKVPFYVVAPSTTVDFNTGNGDRIPIEERSSEEVLEIGGMAIAPEGAKAHHFAFDVTPYDLVTAIVTEKGVVKPVNGKNLKKVVAA